jgi:Spy/CpxP family protein refolding chaperone
MKKIRLTVAAAFAASLCAPTLAQTPQPPTPPAAPPAPGPAGRNVGGPGGFRFQGMLGYQSNFTYMLLTSNKTELKLTDAQNAQIEAIYRESTKTRTETMQKQRKLSDEISALVDADNPNMTAIEAKVRELQTLQGDGMLADIRTNQKYRALLTPEQREQLKTLSPRPPMPGGAFGTGTGPRAPIVPPSGGPGAPDAPAPVTPPAPPAQ